MKNKKRLIDKVTVKVIKKAVSKKTVAPTPTPDESDISPSLIPPKVNVDGEKPVASLPLIYSDIPDVDYVRIGSDYYMVSTTMFLNPGVPIMHSTDLVHWRIISYVYDTLENNDTTNLTNGKNAYGKGSWAASIRYNEGTFYVCFSSNDQNKTYIYTTTDIENGTWTKHSSSGIRHDPALLFEDDHIYIISGTGTISVQEVTLSNNAIQYTGSPKTIITKAPASNTVNIEGAHAYNIGDYYYIFFIEWPGGGRRIQWCYRSKDLMGIYEGRVVFNDKGNYQNNGIAQGGIIDTVYNEWYAILFQDHGAVGRVPVLLEVYWVDDWPILGTNNGERKASGALTVNLPSSGSDYIYADDYFEYTENKLALVWQWNHNPDNSLWSVTERSGYLRLTTGSLAAGIMDARNSLTQRTFGPTCTSEVSIETANMKPGDYGGICAFQENYGLVCVKAADDGSKYVICGIKKSDGTVNEVQTLKLNQYKVYLKIIYNFSGGDKANFYYSLNGNTWTQIGSALSMNHALSVFMGYRTYLFNYATKVTGGYVDFDYYKVYP